MNEQQRWVGLKCVKTRMRGETKEAEISESSIYIIITSPSVKVGHKGLNLWAISYSKGGCLLELQDCVELDV